MKTIKPNLVILLVLLLHYTAVQSRQSKGGVRGAQSPQNIRRTKKIPNYRLDNQEDDFMMRCRVVFGNKKTLVTHRQYALFVSDYCEMNPGETCNDSQTSFWNLNPILQRTFVADSCPGDEVAQQECLLYFLDHLEEEIVYGGDIESLCETTLEVMVMTRMVLPEFPRPEEEDEVDQVGMKGARTSPDQHDEVHHTTVFDTSNSRKGNAPSKPVKSKKHDSEGENEEGFHDNELEIEEEEPAASTQGGGVEEGTASKPDDTKVEEGGKRPATIVVHASGTRSNIFHEQTTQDPQSADIWSNDEGDNQRRYGDGTGSAWSRDEPAPEGNEENQQETDKMDEKEERDEDKRKREVEKEMEKEAERVEKEAERQRKEDERLSRQRQADREKASKRDKGKSEDSAKKDEEDAEGKDEGEYKQMYDETDTEAPDHGDETAEGDENSGPEAESEEQPTSSNEDSAMEEQDKGGSGNDSEGKYIANRSNDTRDDELATVVEEMEEEAEKLAGHHQSDQEADSFSDIIQDMENEAEKLEQGLEAEKEGRSHVDDDTDYPTPAPLFAWPDIDEVTDLPSLEEKKQQNIAKKSRISHHVLIILAALIGLFILAFASTRRLRKQSEHATLKSLRNKFPDHPIIDDHESIVSEHSYMFHGANSKSPFHMGSWEQAGNPDKPEEGEEVILFATSVEKRGLNTTCIEQGRKETNSQSDSSSHQPSIFVDDESVETALEQHAGSASQILRRSKLPPPVENKPKTWRNWKNTTELFASEDEPNERSTTTGSSRSGSSKALSEEDYGSDEEGINSNIQRQFREFDKKLTTGFNELNTAGEVDSRPAKEFFHTLRQRFEAAGSDAHASDCTSDSSGGTSRSNFSLQLR